MDRVRKLLQRIACFESLKPLHRRSGERRRDVGKKKNMSEDDIDFNRVISDPVYRRTVIDLLNAEDVSSGGDAEQTDLPANADPPDGRRDIE